MECDFRFYFNRKKQFCEVFLHDVSDETFKKKGGGRWGYFIAGYKNGRKDKFGEIHVVENKLRHDTITHEIFHVLVEWAWCGGETITRKNEERYADFLDELDRKFVRELRKVRPKIKL